MIVETNHSSFTHFLPEMGETQLCYDALFFFKAAYLEHEVEYDD